MIFLLLCGAELSLLLILNSGMLVYTLDDAYIHLSMAEGIARGYYGVNPGEPAAASSSPLWPVLLAPFIFTPLAFWMPLVLNLLFALAVLLLVRSIAMSFFPSTAGGIRAANLITLASIFAFNLIGLVFTGMEHVLQLWLALAVVRGLMRLDDDGAVPFFLIGALVAGPLIRYENLALTVPALIYLMARRRFSHALIAASITAALTGGFTLFLLSQGLAPLPASVLAKATPFSGDDFLRSLLLNLVRNLQNRQGALLSLAAVLCLPGVRSQKNRALAFWAVSAIGLHLLFGRCGWLDRYEIYIWAAAIMVLLRLHAGVMIRGLESRSFAFAAFMFSMLTLCTAAPYVQNIATIPLASNNIYQQHYQMHRFATRFHKGPVAVNDLGWVSFRNEAYVLDLWGLGSAEALALNRRAESASWMEQLTRSRGVRVAMIYADLFDQIPPSWIAMAQLNLGRKRISAAAPAVTFFATDRKAVAGLKTELRTFSRTLPPGVSCVLFYNTNSFK